MCVVCSALCLIALFVFAVTEHRILMLALRDFNTPKLLHDDELIFKQLIDDLFPDYKGTERKVDLNLQKSVEEVAKKESKLQPEDRFLQKCAELSELMDIRHSIFILGPAGSGKSEIWKTLFKAYRRRGDECVTEYFNPKSFTTNELYGWLTKTDWHPVRSQPCAAHCVLLLACLV